MKNKSLLTLIVITIVVFGFAARLVPHAPNFAPMGAIALFAAVFFKRKAFAFFVPVATWWLSDLFINNFVYESTSGFTFFSFYQIFTVLALFIIVVLSSTLLKKLNIVNVLVSSIAASLIFFLVSNFGVWAQGNLYPMSLSGLGTCYTMGLPFYKATFTSDLIYTGIFFGVMRILANPEFFSSNNSTAIEI